MCSKSPSQVREEVEVRSRYLRLAGATAATEAMGVREARENGLESTKATTWANGDAAERLEHEQ